MWIYLNFETTSLSDSISGNVNFILIIFHYGKPHVAWKDQEWVYYRILNDAN